MRLLSFWRWKLRKEVDGQKLILETFFVSLFVTIGYALGVVVVSAMFHAFGIHLIRIIGDWILVSLVVLDLTVLIKIRVWKKD